MNFTKFLLSQEKLSFSTPTSQQMANRRHSTDSQSSFGEQLASQKTEIPSNPIQIIGMPSLLYCPFSIFSVQMDISMRNSALSGDVRETELSPKRMHSCSVSTSQN